MKNNKPEFCPNCKFNLDGDVDAKARRQTTLDSSLFRKSTLGVKKPDYTESIESSGDDGAFTVIRTNYKLDRKKKVHEDVNRNSYFNITALEMDSKRKNKQKTCLRLPAKTRKSNWPKFEAAWSKSYLWTAKASWTISVSKTQANYYLRVARIQKFTFGTFRSEEWFLHSAPIPSR